MVNDEELITCIQHLMARPLMWAQSVESFEDQICMLLSFLKGPEVDIRGEYNLFCRESGCGNSTLASNYTTFNLMQDKLKEFIDTKIDALILKDLKLNKVEPDR